MSFNSQVEKLLKDRDIISYFTSGNRDLIQFIKTYIEVEKILGANMSKDNKGDLLYDKLDEIKVALSNHTNQLTNHTNQLTNLSTNFSNSTSILQSRIENIILLL